MMANAARSNEESKAADVVRPTTSSVAFRRSIGGRRRHRGAVLIYSIASLVMLTMMATLAVDFGRIQLVKTELQSCADAAAKAAAKRLTGESAGDGIAAAKLAAQTVASLNNANGQAVILNPATDVEVGNFDEDASPEFQVGRTPYNAVRVTTHRKKADGDSVPTTFGTAVGISAHDISTTALARVYPKSPYGIVGIDHIRFASIGVLAKITGNLYSNGNIDVGMPLGLLVGVQGDARSWGGLVKHGSLAAITGSTAQLDQKLQYPPVTVPVDNNNDRIASLLTSNGDLTGLLGVRIPAGKYVVRNLTLLAGIGIDIEGPVEFYVSGDFNMAAGVNLLGSMSTAASNFKVRVMKGGSVNFLANLLVPVYMDVYAPDCDVDINVGVNKFTGAIVAKSLDVNVPLLSQIVQDTTITSAGTLTASLVE